MKPTQEEIYQCAVMRGKVTDSSDLKQIEYDLFKELSELNQAKKIGDVKAFVERFDLLLASSNGAMDRDELYVATYKAYMSGSVADELVDLIFIANTAAKMLGINIDDAQAAKHLYNLRRKD